jgi:hypothetical protein
MIAMSELTIEHIVVALINAASLIVVALISYFAGVRDRRRPHVPARRRRKDQP